MKLTPNAAMRARDVSRPHAEHLAQAEAAIADGSRARTPGRGRGEGTPGGAETNGVVADAAGGRPGEASAGDRPARPGEASAGDRPARPGFPRRRRNPRTGRGRTGR
jgi:hypothetical protein